MKRFRVIALTCLVAMTALTACQKKQGGSMTDEEVKTFQNPPAEMPAEARQMMEQMNKPQPPPADAPPTPN